MHWFESEGRHLYPNSKRLVILADCGGSNRNRARAWKYYLQTKLCDPYQVQVSVTHDPSGASKWNPMEHRLFGPISINLSGRPLDSMETFMNFIAITSNQSGLHVTAVRMTKQYQTGVKITDEQMAGINVTHSEVNPQWNYDIHPRHEQSPIQKIAHWGLNMKELVKPHQIRGIPEIQIWEMGKLFLDASLTDKEIKIRRYQRKLARQQKGSGRSLRTKRRIAKWKRKQKNCRTNAAHQHSRRLSNKAYTLKCEDLKIKTMSKSAKGTVENPGTNVKAKAGLNRVILNAGWGRFNTYCDYKFGNVILVDPKYTSQRCNQCGHTDKVNRKTQSKFKCMACGHQISMHLRMCYRPPGLGHLHVEERSR